jgi:hypothetical protein
MPIRAAHDAVFDRHHPARRHRPRRGRRHRARREALSGRRDHAFRGRRHGYLENLRGARAHAARRAAAPGPWRDDAPRGRRIRSRDGIHRRVAGAAGGAIPAAQGRVRAHHHRTRRRIRRRCPFRRRRDHYAAASAAQSQCHFRRRHQAAFVLPAGTQAGARSRGARASRHRRKSEILSRDRQRSARAGDQGERLRMRRHVHGARGDRTLRGGVRGRLDRLEAFASHFGADFYGFPRHEERIRLVKEPWTAAPSYEFGGGAVVPYRAGESIAWRLAPEKHA